MSQIIASGLSSSISHQSYEINIDWDNQYFDIIMTSETGLTFDDVILGSVQIGSNSYTINYGPGQSSITIESNFFTLDEYSSFPITIRFSKSNISMIKDDVEIQTGSYKNNHVPTTPIYFIDSTEVNNECNVTFDLVLGDLSGESEEEPMLIARYTANASGVVPTFNDGYQYTVNETENDGIYTVEINSGTDFTSCSFSGKSNLLTVEYLKVTSSVTDMQSMFNNCKSLTALNCSNWDTSNVTNMYNMFNGCNNLTLLDVNNFITSNVTDMSYMFNGCNNLTLLDVNNFITNNVTDMSYMFRGCNSLTSLDVSNFNTSKVTNMEAMFYNCNKLTSLVLGNGFNMDNVTNIAYIFSGCNNLILLIVPNATVSMKLDDNLPTRTADSPGTLIVTGDKYNLDTNTPASKFWNIEDKYLIAQYKFNSSIDTLFSEVNEGFVYTHTDIDNGDGTITRTIYSDQLPTIIRFEDCEGLLELLYLNTSELTTLRKSFKNCYNVTSINATDWNISKVTSLYEAFEDCNNLTTLDVSNWDTFNVTDMLGIFDNCHSLTTLDVSNWDTSNVVDMNGVFRDCYSLTSLGDLSNWNTSNVTDMDGMFNDCRLLTELDLSNFDTSKVTTMYQMFCDCYSLTSVDLSNFDTANVINMDGMFNDCQSLTSLDLSNFNTSKVTNMSEMFYACKSLTTLDLSGWDTSKVTEMQWMFGYYEYGDEIMALESIIGLENFDTSKVTSMIGMFCNCRNLTTLDISNWDVSNVNDMSAMFYNCYKLTSLDISNWDTSNVTTTNNMFDNCTNLISITMNNSDYNSVNKIIAQLPTRTTDSMGTLDITGIDDISQVDITTAESKFWNIKIKVAEYKFDGSLYNLIPDFNDGFIYTYEDKMEGNMIATNTNWESGVPNISTGIVQPHGEFPTAKVSDFIEVNPSTTYYTGTLLSEEGMKYNVNVLCWYWYDENKTYIDGVIDEPSVVSPANASFLRVCIEESDLEYNGWTLNNVYVGTNTTSTITRTIYSDSLPTKIRFGSAGSATNKSNSLLACYYLNTSSCTFIQFDWTTRIIEINSSDWNTCNVDTMYCMFTNCNSLTELDVSNWDTSNVTNMSNVFYGCTKLTSLDVSNWDTSNVTNMSDMFHYCYDLTSLDVSNFDTSNVTTMDAMFSNCNSLTSLDLSNWDTRNVTNMGTMFEKCYTLTSIDISNFDTSNVTNMSYMFSNCKSLTTLDLSGFDTSKVTDMNTMFSNCMKLTSIDVSNFNTSKVTDMAYMFYGCNNLTSLDVSSFNTSNVTDMKAMFCNCESLTSIDVSNFDTSKVTNMFYMFRGCQSLTSLDVSNWNTSNVTDMSYMFYFCFDLEHLDVSNWDVSKVTDMSSMFYCCDSLSELDFSRWDVSNVTNMELLFCNCCSFTQNTVNGLRNWDVSNVENMCAMIDCLCLNGVTTIDLSGWDVSKVTDMNSMLEYNTELKYLNLNNWILNENVDTTELLKKSNNVEKVSIMNSNAFTVNKVIAQLPTRTNDSMGTLNITDVDDISQVDITTAESKYWNVKQYKIAEYKFDKYLCENLIPEFNEGFTYTYEDSSIMDGFVTRKLYAAENDFVDISKCISRSKETYNSGIYAETDIVEPAPMFLNNEILFRGHEWDSLNIDLSDYQGKEINISFTIEHFANQWSELNVGIELYDDTHLDDYSGVIYEDCLSENLIKEYSVTWTIPNEKCRLYLGGMYLELSNINIMIEDYNLFPNHILTEYDYVNTLGFKVNKPSLYDNKLAFSHYWNAFNIECEQFKGKEVTISFDVEEIANSYDYSQCEIYILQTVQVPLNDHYSNTFIIESDHIYIGGNGIKITNLQILVDNRTTEETISNLPTRISFGQGHTEAQPRELSLLGVEYLNITNTTKIIYNLFARCQNLQYVNGINDWDITGISDLTTVFYHCHSLNQLDLSNWDTSNITNMYCMFRGCESLTTLDLSNWDTGNVTNMSYMFADCPNLTTLDVSKFDTCNVTNMNNMFYKCAKLTSLDVSNFDTSNATNMYYMFGNCNNLTSLDVSNFDTSKVTRMDCMFYGCAKLTSIDISGFDTCNVTDMNNMFYKCAKLTSIDISGFDTSKVTNMSNMFNTCSNLTHIEMQNSDSNSVNKIIAELPTRTTDSIGILNITGVDDISQVDTATAQSKYWNISTLKQYKIHLITVNNEKVKKIHNQNKKLKINIYKY